MRFNMTLDEEFEPIDTDPIIPDKLLDRTLKHLSTLRRVDVERRRGTNSWKKVNGFSVSADANGNTEGDVEQISGWIVMIAQADHDEHGGTEHYRAKYHIRAKNGGIQRKTFAFKMTDDSDEPEPTLDKLEEQEVLAVAFDRAIALIEIQSRHIDGINTQMLSQAQTQAGQTAPLLQTIETLVSKYHDGLNMQATALQAISEMERSTKEAELKGERDKALLDILAVAAPKAMEQFGSYLNKKSGNEDETPTEDKKTDPKGGKVVQIVPPGRRATVQSDPKPAASPSQEPEHEAETEAEEEMSDPLTMFAHAFRDSIQSEQWMQLSESLSKTEMKLLKRATTALDDKATAEGVLAFKEGLRPAKYLRLNRILDKEQQEMVMKLLEVIVEHEEPADDPDAEEPEAEPEE